MSALNSLKIASPCGVDWSSMEGTDQVRFCSECRLSVYNLSEMTTEEAVKVVEEAEGRLCVRLYKRADGTVITRDCPVGASRRRRRAVVFGSIAAGVMALAAGVGALFFRNSKQCSSPYAASSGTRIGDLQPFKTVNQFFPGTFPQAPPPQVLMGDIAVIPTPPQTGNSGTSPSGGPTGTGPSAP